MNALVVVDVQNDFCKGGALEIPGADALIPVINDRIKQFEKNGHVVAFTQDYHPVFHISFASSWPMCEVGDLVKSQNGDVRLWPDHCVRGTPGVRFHPHLYVPRHSKVYQKGTNFETEELSAATFRHSSLVTDLKSSKVKRVFVGGLALDYCVKATALDLAKYFNTVIVMIDASAATTEKARVEAIGEDWNGVNKLCGLGEEHLA